VNRPMTRPEKRILILLGLLVFLAYVGLLLLIVYWVFLTPDISQVQIISPPYGFIAREGETIVVQAVATGRDLVKAELWVDQLLVERATNPGGPEVTNWPITHSWVSQGQGQHQLSVRVYDLDDRAVESPSVVVGVAPLARIVFASNRDGDYDIYTMNSDGREVVRITDGPEQDREPSWSSTGFLLFASTAVEGGTDIWLLEPDSQEQMNLTGALGGDYSPHWSPGNGTIAFISDRHGPSQLYLMNPDGSEQFQLTREDTYLEQPSWAPDGSSLLVSAKRDGNQDVYSISLGGETVSRLTDDPAQDWYPAWSPRGGEIAFVSNREGSHQIFVMRADGTEQRGLTAFHTGAEQPRWSPDGEWITFVAYTGQGEGFKAREIYIMRPDGSDQMRLTDNAFDDTEPSWCQ
jgi:Tol biopolymer transport system component